jgi:predicted peroxiredoxin
MNERGRLLVHLTCGVENPTRAALALLVAATAAKDGHQVDVFIAGDGVSLLRPSMIAAVVGIGTGSVAEHLDALQAAGAGLWASGQSSAARGILPDDLAAVGFAASPPSKLVELAMTVDRTLTY